MCVNMAGTTVAFPPSQSQSLVKQCLVRATLPEVSSAAQDAAFLVIINQNAGLVDSLNAAGMT